MNSSFLLVLNKRIKIGKQHNIRLRKNGKIPAVVYNKNLSTPIYFDKKDLHALSKIIMSGFKLIKCKLDEDNFFVFIKDIYKHPSNLNVLHLDLQRVQETDIITSSICLQFIKEKESPGIKKGGFLIKHTLHINIKASATDMPTHINVDLSKLDLNKPIFLSNIKMPHGVTLANIHKNPSELLIASAMGSRTGTIKEEKLDQSGG